VIPGAWYEKVVLEYLTYCFGLLQELAARGGNGLFRHAEESLV